MLHSFRNFLANIQRFKTQGAHLGQLKYYGRWKKSLRKESSSLKDEQPWITFEVIDLLKAKLTPTSKIFEFGGGGSTLFWLNYADEVVTVEHNEAWFTRLSDTIKHQHKSAWKGIFIAPQKNSYVVNPDIANPFHYSSSDVDNQDVHFYNYASAIDQYSDNYFDIILIDGRARPSCMIHAIPKLKQHGYLVLDNSEREYYLSFFKDQIAENFTLITDRYGPCPYLHEFSKTSVWKKK